MICSTKSGLHLQSYEWQSKIQELVLMSQFWQIKQSNSRYQQHFLKMSCDPRTSTNIANHPTSHPCECDCNITNMYFIFTKTNVTSFLTDPLFISKVKTTFDH